MAIAFVSTFGNGGGGASLTLTVPAAGVGQGHTLLVAVKGVNPTASVTDTAGNTYTQVGTNYNDGAAWGNLWIGYMTTALVSGNTLTFSNTQNSVAAEFSGVASTSAVDQVSTANSNVSGAITSSSTATLTGSTDLYVCAIEKGNTASTFTDTTTGLTTVFSNTTDGTSLAEIKYKILAATTAINYQGTLSANSCGMIVAGILAAAAGPPSPTGSALPRTRARVKVF